MSIGRTRTMGDPLDTRTDTRVLKTRAHPARGFVVEERSRDERGVADRQGVIDADRSTASKHQTMRRPAGANMRRHPWTCA